VSGQRVQSLSTFRLRADVLPSEGSNPIFPLRMKPSILPLTCDSTHKSDLG
jgi:hypothetical protein